MLRIHPEDLSDSASLPGRRGKRRVARLKPSLQPEMERLEIRIVPATKTWSGVVDNIWSRAGNWSENAVPAAGDDLVFPSSASRLTTVDNLAAGTTFQSVTIAGSGYQVYGNSFNLAGGITTTFGSGSALISPNVSVGNGLVSVASGGSLAIDGSIGGASGLTLSGGGSLSMTGTTVNTYSGTTTVNAGTLILSKTGVLAVPGNLVIGDGVGSDLVQYTSPDQIADFSTVTLTSSGSLDLNSNSDVIGSLVLTGASVTTGTGTLTLSGDLTTNSSTTTATIAGNLGLTSGAHNFMIADPTDAVTPDVVVSAVITGAGGFTKAGTGTLQLSGNNSFAGAVAINVGRVNVASDNALGSAAGGTTVASGAELDLLGGVHVGAEPLSVAGTGVSPSIDGSLVSFGNNQFDGDIVLGSGTNAVWSSGGGLILGGAISGASSTAFNKEGTGTLTLQGAGANSYAGPTNIDAGTLVGGKTGVVAIPGDLVIGTSSVSGTFRETANGQIADSGNLTVNSGSTLDLNNSNDAIGSLTMTGSTVTTGSGTLTLGGNVTTNASTTLSTIGGNLDLGGATRTFAIGVGSADPDLSVTANISGTGAGIIKTGGAGANLWLSGNNSYDGTTTIQAGSITAASNNALGSTAGGTVVQAGATLYLVGNTTIPAGEALTASGNGLGGTAGALDSSLSGESNTYAGNISLAADSVLNAATGSTLVLGGAISGGFNLSENQGGTLVFSGSSANTYTGSMTVNAGVLQLNKTGVVAVPGPLTVGTSSSIATVRELAANQIADASNVTVNDGSTLDLNGFNDTITGLFLTGGTVTTGAGTLTLGGNVTVSDPGNSDSSSISGSLDLGGASRTFSVADGSALADLTVSAVISGTAAGINKTGAGGLALAGANTYTAAANVQAGPLILANSTGLGTHDASVSSGAALVLSGPINVGNGVTIAGTGVGGSGAILAFSGSPTLSGSVTMSAISSIGAASGATLILGGAIVDNVGPYNLTVSNGATGRTIFSADNSTLDGNVTVASGYLRALNNNALGDGSPATTITVQTGASLEFSSGITTPTTQTLVLQGVPVSGSSKLINVAGSNTFGGNVTLQAAESIDVASGTVFSILGAIGDGGNFYWVAKNGAGNLNLVGTSSTRGSLVDSAGLIQVNGTLSAAPVTIDSGTLVGTGHVQGIRTTGTGGTVRPGPVVGTGILNSDSDVQLAPADTFQVVLNGNTVGTQYDQLNVVGNVTLSSSILSVSLGYSPVAGTTFTIVNNDGTDAVSGTFNGLAEGSTLQVGNQPFQISYVGGTGNDVTLTALTRVDTWTGAGGNTNWTNAANWGGIAPVAGDQLVLPSTSNLVSSNDFTAGTRFDSIVLSGSGYNITGNAIQLDHGIKAAYLSSSSTIAPDIQLNNNSTIEVDGGCLTLSGVISGSYTVNKTGVGLLALSGVNSYVGLTTVSRGTLAISNSFSLGSSNLGAVVSSGATLDVSGTINIDPAAITISGSGVGGAGAIVNSGGNNVIPVTLAGDATIGVAYGTNLLIPNVIDDGGSGFGLTKIGGGGLVVDATNTYTGTTTVSGGTLYLDNSGGTTISGPLVINGTGGSATVQETFANQIADTSSVTLLGSSATFELNNLNDTINSLTFTGGAVTTGTGTLALGGGVTANAASSTATIGGNLDLGGLTRTFTVGAGTDPSGVDLAISAVVSNGGITKAGLGKLALSGANIYALGTTISTGVLAVSNNAALGSGGVTDNAELDLSGGISVSNALSINSTGTAIKNVSGSNVLNGLITLVANTSIDTAASTSLLLSNTIGDGGGNFSLTKTGTGTLQASGTNTYGGGTTISAGLLQVFSSQATGTTGTLRVAGGATFRQSTSTLNLPSGGLLIGGASGTSTYLMASSQSYTVHGAITLAGPTNFTVGSTGSLIVAGTIGGSGPLILPSSTTGKVILSGSETYTGSTTLAGGTLQVDGDTSSSSGLTVNGGTLTGNGTTPSITGTGGTIFPGHNPGILHSGAVNFGAGTSFQAVLGGTVAGTGYNQLVTTGPVTLGGGSLQLSLSSYSPAVGDVLTIIDNQGVAAISGTFAGLPEGGSLNLFGYTFQISYVGGTGNDVTLTSIAATTTTVTSNTSTPVFGQSLTFTADVAANIGSATGTVTFKDNGVALPGGTVSLATVNAHQIATYTISTFGVGHHVITADYSGTTNIGTSSGTLSPNPLIVSPADTTTQIGSSSATITYGQSLTFTAIVTANSPGSGTPSGTVTFKDGSTVLGTTALNNLGIAAFTTTHLSGSATPHSITAIYSPGNGNDVASNSNGSPFSQTVDKASLTLTADNQARLYGDANPTLTATITGFANNETLATSDLAGAFSLTTPAGPISLVAGNPYVINASVGTLTSNDYAFSFVSGLLSINKAMLSISADNQARTYGDANPTLTATYSGFKNGETLATSDLTGALSLSTAASPTSPVAGSPYAIVAGLGSLASGNYGLSVANGSLVVTTAASVSSLSSSAAPSVLGQSVTFTAAVSQSPAGLGVPTGSVVFTDGSTTLGTVALNGSGMATISLSTLSVGNHSISFSYSGDGNYNAGSSSTLSQTVNQANTTVSVNAPVSNTVFGQSVTLTALVNVSSPGAGVPTGVVSFFDGSTQIAQVALQAGGSAMLTTSSLAVGSHSITAVYGGDPGFNNSGSSILTESVTQASISGTVSSSVNPGLTGRPVTFTANFSAVSPGAGAGVVGGGVVSFFDGSTLIGTSTLAAGTATLAIPSLSLGSHSIVAAYGGDANFLAGSSTTLAQTINQAVTTVSVTPPGATVFGQAASFSINVSSTDPLAGTATGAVILLDGSTPVGSAPLVNGSATIALATLSVGTHSLSVQYGGDVTFPATNSLPINQVVAFASTTTTLVSSSDSSVAGLPVTFTATIGVQTPGAGSPTGTVIFLDGSTQIGSTPLVNGLAAINVTSLSVSTHSIMASYLGDSSFSAAGSSSLTQNVSKGDVSASLSSSVASPVFGQAITYTMTVAPNNPLSGTPSGSVTFLDGSTVLAVAGLSGGSATYITGALSVGTHAIRAVYSGDGVFNPSSFTVNSVVARSATASVVTSSLASAVFGQRVTYTATIVPTGAGAGIPGGSVTFYDGATPIGSALVGTGQAHLTVVAGAVGNQSITAVYQGDGHYVPSTSPALNVPFTQANTQTYLAIQPTTQGKIAGYLLSFGVATLAPGGGVPTGSVVLYALGKPYQSLTLHNGLASIFIPKATALKLVNFAAKYLGDATHNPSVSPILGLNGSPIRSSLRAFQAFRHR